MKQRTSNEHNRLVFNLPDGRQLGYAEYGDPEGHPIFYFHGFPGCRIEAGQFHEVAVSNQSRIIGIDRPGMGLSTFQKNRKILSWPSDVVNLADHLGIEKFSILSHSAGSPFVAACAYAIPERLQRASMISGLAPLNHLEAYARLSWEKKLACLLIRILPWSAKIMMRKTVDMLKKHDDKKQKIGNLPAVDQIIFQNPQYKKNFMDLILESFRNGVDGPAQDMQLICKPWGFDLRAIKIPISIWHGTLDRSVPVSHAKILARLIPHSQLNILKNEGHLSILQNPIKAILFALNG